MNHLTPILLISGSSLCASVTVFDLNPDLVGAFNQDNQTSASFTAAGINIYNGTIADLSTWSGPHSYPIGNPAPTFSVWVNNGLPTIGFGGTGVVVAADDDIFNSFPVQMMAFANGEIINETSMGSVAPKPGGIHDWQGSTSLPVIRATPGTKYIGLKLYEADGPHYGWLEAIFTSTDVALTRFAFETTPGQSILAGQTTSAVPEPSTYGILAGLVGLSAIGARRRSRKQVVARV